MRNRQSACSKQDKSGSVLVVGSFGYRRNQLDGQTVKTRQVTELLRQRHPYCTRWFCTQDLMRYPWRLLSLFGKMLLSRTIVCLYPACGGFRTLVPPLWRAASLLGKRMVYVAIGSNQTDCFAGRPPFANPRPDLACICRKMHGFLPETQAVLGELARDWGFQHIALFPNFRPIPNDRPRPLSPKGTLRLVYMGRIMYAKGYDVACEFVRRHANEGLDITLHFYGQIVPECKEDFLGQMRELAPYGVSYCGALEPSKIHSVLRAYDLMVFPTRGDGIPGTVIDGFMAALPVVCTDWTYAREMVTDGENGFIVPFHTEETQTAFDECILRLYADRTLLQRMREAAYQSRLAYSPEVAWQVLSKFV